MNGNTRFVFPAFSVVTEGRILKKNKCGRLTGLAWIRLYREVMDEPKTLVETPATKPISVGLTCWLWQRSRPRAIIDLASRMGVKVEVTEKVHGLRREVEAQVSGKNVDRFIGEFVRHC